MTLKKYIKRLITHGIGREEIIAQIKLYADKEHLLRRDLVKLLIAKKDLSTIKERSIEFSKMSSLPGIGSKNDAAAVNEPVPRRSNNLDQQLIKPEPIDVDAHPVLNAVKNEINDRRHSADDFNLNPASDYSLLDVDDPEEVKDSDAEKADGS